MNILLTGSSGLLGSAILDYFKNKGVNIFKFDRKDFSWIDQKKILIF